MELVFVKPFPEAISAWKERGRALVGKMSVRDNIKTTSETTCLQALEPYPPSDGTRLAGDDSEYKQAEEFVKTLDESDRRSVVRL